MLETGFVSETGLLRKRRVNCVPLYTSPVLPSKEFHHVRLCLLVHCLPGERRAYGGASALILGNLKLLFMLQRPFRCNQFDILNIVARH
jgi:hypothetical protein